MKIFEENGKIRLQLMDMKKGIFLFNFSVEKELFEELRDHIIEYLLAYRIEEKTNEVGNYLTEMAKSLEPKTHCCECTPGEHFERHMVHIQYPDCKCESTVYVLKKNK